MRRRASRVKDQAGMNTAEYAYGTVVACGFACLLLQLLTNWRVLIVQMLEKAFELRFGWPPFHLPL